MKFFQLDRVTVFARVVIYLACGICLLGLVYSTLSFIYVMFKADDLSDVLVTETLELPTLTQEQAARPWVAESGTGRFRLYKIYGEFSYLKMPRVLAFMAYIRVLGLWALFFIGTVQMARLLRDVSRRKAFARDNARRLRIVACAMVGGALLKFIMMLGPLIVFRDDIKVVGSSIPWGRYIWWASSPGLLLGAVIVIVISEVFRLGNRLQEDQELTV
ncbi:MAG: DUF2975 domain-containing protein [Candidatus Aminicenantes bacterium]|nr:DUF2975 domain-containing protein [Candidatus Aminicenantes bacterium]